MGKCFAIILNLKIQSQNEKALSTALHVLPVKHFSEWNVGVSRPPDDHLGGEPGAPAQVVDSQHEDQHLDTTWRVLLCRIVKLGKTLMILLLPLFIARAAEQAWLLLCLMQKVNLLDISNS